MSEFPYPYDAKLPAIEFPPPNRQFTLTPGLLGILLAVITACFALSNITVIPVSERMSGNMLAELWLAFSFGLIGAEAGLLAIAAVLGPEKGLVRHLLVVPLAGIWILAWLLGYGFTWWNHTNQYFYPEWKEVVADILIIPVLFCACELPLWIFRGLLRWRIELLNADSNRRAPPPLSIGGILIATGAVAIALAGVRMGRFIEGVASEAEWWGACGIGMAFAGGISLVTLPLCTWATLRCPWLWAGRLAMIAWLFIAAFLLVWVISTMVGSWPPLEFWRPFTGMVFGFASGLMGTLSLVRLAGYRLIWGRDSFPVIPSASAMPSEDSPAPKP